MRCFATWACLCSALLWAQKGIGLLFQGRFNYATERGEPVPTALFSDAAIGLHGKNYWWGAGWELSLLWVYKGGPSEVRLPLVNQDFSPAQQTAYKAVEAGFRFGPRWKVWYPKTGIVGGYRYQSAGLSTDPRRSVNRWYAFLPLGLTLELPVQFGTTGVSAYYEIGLTNLLRRPAPTPGAYEGSKLRRFLFEVHVMWGETR
ncbi:MAG: hypothetical protein KatS3mg026_0973 [Bacteroidia bacterium]|nr:MAG: hypothetical protein KatS3mg026_0973 [Bacteroidia bacterium]